MKMDQLMMLTDRKGVEKIVWACRRYRLMVEIVLLKIVRNECSQ